MIEHAEVIRLESQLTVPTRNCAHLSDLWIAIAWCARLTEWAREFDRVAERYNVPVTAAGKVHLVPMSDRQGWIVARGVDLSFYSPEDIEAIVRGLVAEVNGAISPPAFNASAASSSSTWSHRIRSAVQASGSAAMEMVPDPRRRAEADAPSRG
jgi:hypothetical protein